MILKEGGEKLALPWFVWNRHAGYYYYNSFIIYNYKPTFAQPCMGEDTSCNQSIQCFLLYPQTFSGFFIIRYYYMQMASVSKLHRTVWFHSTLALNERGSAQAGPRGTERFLINSDPAQETVTPDTWSLMSQGGLAPWYLLDGVCGAYEAVMTSGRLSLQVENYLYKTNWAKSKFVGSTWVPHPGQSEEGILPL